jgi:hypothetical protein
MKSAVLILLVAASASAQPSPVDDEPLGQLLRASFGVGAVAELRDVTCTSKKCTAIDHLNNDRVVSTTSAELRDQLNKVEPNQPIWRIDCTSFRRHGKCNIQINADDDVLAADLMSMGGSKIGQVSFSGYVIVSCAGATCTAKCDPAARSDAYACQATDPRAITTPGFADVIRRRFGGDTATLRCDRNPSVISNGLYLGCSPKP